MYLKWNGGLPFRDNGMLGWEMGRSVLSSIEEYNRMECIRKGRFSFGPFLCIKEKDIVYQIILQF